MIENVPLMIAWLPTTEARMAIASTGHLKLSVSQVLVVKLLDNLHLDHVIVKHIVKYLVLKHNS